MRALSERMSKEQIWAVNLYPQQNQSYVSAFRSWMTISTNSASARAHQTLLTNSSSQTASGCVAELTWCYHDFLLHWAYAQELQVILHNPNSHLVISSSGGANAAPCGAIRCHRWSADATYTDRHSYYFCCTQEHQMRMHSGIGLSQPVGLNPEPCCEPRQQAVE